MFDSSPDPDLVTVIIPSFNYAHFLPETLESVIGQSYDRWECLVVDDGSTDNTEAIVRSYGRGDRRIRYIHQRSRGVSAARNRGIGDSRGAYVQFLDADDLIESRKLECHVRYLEAHRDVGIVYSPVRYFTTDAKGERKYSMRDPDERWMPETSGRGIEVIRALARGNITAINCPLVRRDVIGCAGLFNERLGTMEDWEYWIRCATQETRFQYLDEPGTYALVRNHPTSTTKNEIRMAGGYVRMCRMTARANPDPRARALFREKLAAAREALYALQIRKGMPGRGALNGVILGLSLKQYRLAMTCFLGLALLPLIGKKRFATLLLDISWTKAIKRYFSG